MDKARGGAYWQRRKKRGKMQRMDECLTRLLASEHDMMRDVERGRPGRVARVVRLRRSRRMRQRRRLRHERDKAVRAACPERIARVAVDAHRGVRIHLCAATTAVSEGRELIEGIRLRGVLEVLYDDRRWPSGFGGRGGRGIGAVAVSGRRHLEESPEPKCRERETEHGKEPPKRDRVVSSAPAGPGREGGLRLIGLTGAGDSPPRCTCCRRRPADRLRQSVIPREDTDMVRDGRRTFGPAAATKIKSALIALRTMKSA